MDASDEGLCILEPALHQFIRVRFTKATQQEFVETPAINSINVREMQSCVLATLHWGPIWARQYKDKPIHVCAWIDNTSAVAWTQRRASRQPRAQLYNRLLSLAEFQYSLVVTAQHVPGKDNVMADAGSRAWTTTHPLFNLWTNLSVGWTQVTVRPRFANLSKLWELCSGATPSQALLLPSIEVIGTSGTGSRS